MCEEKPIAENPFSIAAATTSSVDDFPSHHKVWVWKFVFKEICRRVRCD
jgi:hypothetical protein